MSKKKQGETNKNYINKAHTNETLQIYHVYKF